MAQYFWQGGAAGDWNEAGNWNTGDGPVDPDTGMPLNPPGAADDAVFNNVGAVTIDGDDIAANSIIGFFSTVTFKSGVTAPVLSGSGANGIVIDGKDSHAGTFFGTLKSGSLSAQTAGGIVEGGNLLADSFEGTVSGGSVDVSTARVTVSGGLVEAATVTGANISGGKVDADLVTSTSFSITVSGGTLADSGALQLSSGAFAMTVSGKGTATAGSLALSNSVLDVSGTGKLTIDKDAEVTTAVVRVGVSASGGTTTFNGDLTIDGNVHSIGGRLAGLTVGEGATALVKGVTHVDLDQPLPNSGILVGGAGGSATFQKGLRLGSTGSANFAVTNGTATVTADTGSAGSAAIELGSGLLAVLDSGTLTVTGDTIIGNRDGHGGEFKVSGSAPVATLTGKLVLGSDGGDADLNMAGSGAVLTVHGMVEVGETADAHPGSSSFATGAVVVDGGSKLIADKLRVGGAKADPNQPNNGAGGSWTYAGGKGDLTLSNGGSVWIKDDLTLLGRIAGTSSAPVPDGSIDLANGGHLAIGSVAPSGGAGATAYISSGHSLVGHGMIESDVTGSVDVGGGLKISKYALTLTNDGTLEAKDGSLLIQGNLAGTGTVKIDANSAVEIYGTVGAADQSAPLVFDFQDLSNAKLILHDLKDFHGEFDNVSLGSLPASGSEAIKADGTQIVLPEVRPGTVTGIISSTVAVDSATGRLALRVMQGDEKTLPSTNYGAEESTFYLGDAAPTSDAPYFFLPVKQDDGSTVLEKVPGDPIALAVGAPAALQHVPGGPPVRVAVITKDADEAAAMAEVIKKIDPHAVVYQMAVGKTFPLQTAIETARANADIIVDDLNGFNDFRTTNILFGQSSEDTASKAVEHAVEAGRTFITVAGNYGVIPHTNVKNEGIVGHNADPLAITVAAMNWLGTPAAGQYLSSNTTEPFSSAGPSVDVTAPDGAQLLEPLSELNPFFGTSEAAPVVAGIAALMMRANWQLDPGLNPHAPSLIQLPILVAKILRDTADHSIGDPASAGAGLVRADEAVAEAIRHKKPFYHPPSGEAALNDGPAAAVVTDASLSQPDGNVIAGASVEIFVQLSGPVAVTGGTPLLALNDGGSASYDASASDPDGGLLAFRHVAGAGNHAADLAVTGFNLNGATVHDNAGLTPDFSVLVGAGTGVSVNSPLDVSSVGVSHTGEIQIGDTVQISLTFNEAVVVTGAPVLQLSTGAAATYDAAKSDLPAGVLVFDYTAGSGEAGRALSVVGVDYSGSATVKDASGNNADLATALDHDLDLQIGPAMALAFFASQETPARTGDLVHLGVQFSNPLTFDLTAGAPTLNLDDGGVATFDAKLSDATKGILAFDYTVVAGQQTPSLQVTQFNLNGAVIKDPFGVNADASPLPSMPGLLSINTPLLVQSLTASVSGEVTTGATVELTLHMSEGSLVRQGGIALALTNGETANFDIGKSDLAAGVLVFDYVANSTALSSNLQIADVILDGTLTDKDGNAADFSAAEHSATGISVNTPLGLPLSISLVGAEGGITTSGAIAGLASANGAVAISEAGSVIATVQADANGAWSFTPTGLPDGSHTFTASFGGGAGTAALTFTLDSIAPSVVSVDGSPPDDAGNAGTNDIVQIHLQASEALDVFGLPVLHLNDGGMAIYSSGSGTNLLTFTYIVGAGDHAGSLAVTSLDRSSGSLLDTAGNELVGNAAGDLGFGVGSPGASADLYITPKDAPLVVGAGAGVLANDAGASSAMLIASAAHGALTLNNDGSFTYTPQSGFSGTDNFTYTASDGHSSGAVTTASIVVGATEALTEPEQQIGELYVGYYNRAPDVGGLNFWIENFTTPPPETNAFYHNLPQAADSFADPGQAETVALYPFLAHPQSANYEEVVRFVQDAYHNLFNRETDPTGEAYWSTAIAKSLGIAVPTFHDPVIDSTGPVTASRALLAFIFGALGTDAQTVANKVTAGLYYKHYLEDTGVGATADSAHAAFAGVTSDPASVLASEAATNAFVQSVLNASSGAPLAAQGVLDDTQHVMGAGW